MSPCHGVLALLVLCRALALRPEANDGLHSSSEEANGGLDSSSEISPSNACSSELEGETYTINACLPPGAKIRKDGLVKHLDKGGQFDKRGIPEGRYIACVQGENYKGQNLWKVHANVTAVELLVVEKRCPNDLTFFCSQAVFGFTGAVSVVACLIWLFHGAVSTDNLGWPAWVLRTDVLKHPLVTACLVIGSYESAFYKRSLPFFVTDTLAMLQCICFTCSLHMMDWNKLQHTRLSDESKGRLHWRTVTIVVACVVAGLVPCCFFIETAYKDPCSVAFQKCAVRSSNVFLRWLACATVGVASNTLGLGVADELQQIRAHMSRENEGSWKDDVRLPLVKLMEENHEALQGLAVAIIGMFLPMILEATHYGLYTYNNIVDVYRLYGCTTKLWDTAVDGWLSFVTSLLAFLISMGPITLGRAKLRLQDKLNSLRTHHDLSWKASALEELLDKSNGKFGFGFAVKGALLVDGDYLFSLLVSLLLFYSLFIKVGSLIHSSQYLEEDASLSGHKTCTINEVAQYDGKEWVALQSEILSTIASYAKLSQQQGPPTTYAISGQS